jgi:hypothetical protein
MPAPRVVYIHPSPHHQAEGSHIPMDGFQNQPAGLTGALNLLADTGVDICGVNQAIELRLDPSFSLVDWISERAPDAVLVELHWYIHAHGARAAVQIAKDVAPNATVVVGGLTASAYAPEVISWQGVDMVIAGESEEPLRQLGEQLTQGSVMPAVIPNVWSSDHGVVTPPHTRWVADSLEPFDHVTMAWMRNLEELERSDFPYRNRWLLTGRGCPKACFFCGGSRESLAHLWGRERMIVRSPVAVANDVVRLGKTGVKAVHLTHDLLLLGEQFWEPFFDTVRSSGVTLGLGNESWGPLPDQRFIDAWSATFDLATSYLALSPTSAWSGLRRFASRGTEDEKFFSVLNLLAKARFPLHVFFLLNLPGETVRTLERTMGMAQTIITSYPRELLRIEAQTAPIDPASPAALGLVPSARFKTPSLDDYLAVSGGQHVPSLNWPKSLAPVDVGQPVAVNSIRPREIAALSENCPSLVQRWRELLTTEHDETRAQTD